MTTDAAQIIDYRFVAALLCAVLLTLTWRLRQQARALAHTGALGSANEALLRQVLDAASVALFLLDAHGRIVRANQRMAQLFGVPLETLIGTRYVDLLPAAGGEVGEANNARGNGVAELAGDGRQVVTCARRFCRGDGSEFPGSVTTRRCVGAGDGLAAIVGEIVDATAGIRAQEAQVESEFLWKCAIEGSGDGVWDWDITTNAAAYSTRWKSMLGYSDDEIVANNDEWVQRIHPDDRQSIAAAMQDYLDGKTAIYVVEYRLRCKDGSYKWILGRGMIVSRAGDGQPLRMIGTHTDISARKEMEEQIRQMAFYDPLTHLPNRRLLVERLTQVMAASKRSGRYAAAMFLDLDNFKPLNDVHGHSVGDLLLAEVARRLLHCVREADSVARFGGDEFVVVLGELTSDRAGSAAQARSVADKVRAVVAQPYHLAIRHADGSEGVVEHRCTASVGVMLFVNHQYTQDEVLKWADAAMYRAKQSGRDRVELY